MQTDTGVYKAILEINKSTPNNLDPVVGFLGLYDLLMRKHSMHVAILPSLTTRSIK